MHTTALIVEFLVIGVASLASLVFLIFAIPGVELELSPDAWNGLRSWAAALVAVASAFAYLLGFVANYAAYCLFWPVEERVRRKYFSTTRDFRRIEVAILQRGKERVQDALALELSFMRISRTGVLVVVMLAVALLLRGFIPLGLIASGIAAVYTLSLRYRTDRYFSMMSNAWEMLEPSPQADIAPER